MTASITGVTLNGGRGTAANTGFQPGGLIRNNGTLTLDRVRVTGGIATSGGGVANTGGTLTINRSLIDNNTGGGDSGGLLNFDGGTVIVRNTTITGNSANQGGGFFSWGDPGATTRCSSTSRSPATAAASELRHGRRAADAQLDRRANIDGNCPAPPANLGGNVEGSDDCLFEHARRAGCRR